MRKNIKFKDITIRTGLQSGDLGYVIHLHGILYKKEFNYGMEFENYVAKGFCEFYSQFDPNKDGVWIAEKDNKIIGTLFLMHREDKIAQLRYFLILPEFRGTGLGKHLMQLFIDSLKEKKYKSAFLWTTDELPVAAKIYNKHGFELTEEKSSESFGKPLKERRFDLKRVIYN